MEAFAIHQPIITTGQNTTILTKHAKLLWE